jgi:hypothetical protein
MAFIEGHGGTVSPTRFQIVQPPLFTMPMTGKYVTMRLPVVPSVIVPSGLILATIIALRDLGQITLSKEK